MRPALRPLLVSATALCLLSSLSQVAWAKSTERAKPHPRGHTAAQAKPPAISPKDSQIIIAAANPLATEAGLEVLQNGGTVIDAAVAIQAVLGLVEPQSSGVGGGAFLLYRDGQSGLLTTYDGREMAPKGARPDMFLGADGQPLSYGEAVTSGRATGTPGAIAALYLAHQGHGKLPWAKLFDPAVKLAKDGFVISPRLGHYLDSKAFPQAKAEDFKTYFTKPDGTPYRTGDRLKNQAYAETLLLIAAKGADAFRTGPLAEAIVAKVHEGPLAGSLSLEDLANYQPLTRAAICAPWLTYQVCTPPPPSSGVTLLQGLKMAEQVGLTKRGPKDPIAWVQMAEVERRLYADRDQYVGDPAFVSVPVTGLIDQGYVDSRAATIGETYGPAPSYGLPRGAELSGPDRTLEPGGTTHFVIQDRFGNVLSMTTTVESYFGSGRMVGGFFLNNQLTDFSSLPTTPQGQPAANAVAPLKRPRSSMSPVIVLSKDKKQVVAALGSPGGSAILSYNLKALIGTLAWNLSMKEAFALPNLVARGTQVSAETDSFSPELLAGIRARGLNLQPGQNENSGLHGFVIRPGGEIEAAADPRREGTTRLAQHVPAHTPKAKAKHGPKPKAKILPRTKTEAKPKTGAKS